MLQSSGDLRAVQELLGHASIGTTQVYTALDFQHLAAVYDAAHPRARRQGAVPGGATAGAGGRAAGEAGGEGSARDGDSVGDGTGDSGLAGRPDVRAQGALKKP